MEGTIYLIVNNDNDIIFDSVFYYEAKKVFDEMVKSKPFYLRIEETIVVGIDEDGNYICTDNNTIESFYLEDE